MQQAVRRHRAAGGWRKRRSWRASTANKTAGGGSGRAGLDVILETLSTTICFPRHKLRMAPVTMPKPSGPFARAARWARLQQLHARHGALPLAEAAAALQVSAMTIRR